MVPRSRLLSLTSGGTPERAALRSVGGYEGFVVDGPHGRMGTLHHLVDRPGAPELAIRAHRWSRTMLHVPARDVVTVDLAARRLVVADRR